MQFNTYFTTRHKLPEYYQNLVWNSSLLSVTHIQELESYFDDGKSVLANTPSHITAIL